VSGVSACVEDATRKLLSWNLSYTPVYCTFLCASCTRVNVVTVIYVLLHASGGVRHVLVGERVESQRASYPVGHGHLEHVVVSTQQLVVLAVVAFAAHTCPVICTARSYKLQLNYHYCCHLSNDCIIIVAYVAAAGSFHSIVHARWSHQSENGRATLGRVPTFLTVSYCTREN